MLEDKKLQEYEKDKEMVLLAQEKNSEALEYILHKYKPLVLAKSRLYFLIGATKEDLIQEGMIGLYKGIIDFDVNKYTNFRAFAELCIQRQMISAVRTATRQKHKPLNSYVSLNKTVGEDETDQSYMDFIGEGDVFNPETVMISQENKYFLELQITKNLSDLEKKVLVLYVRGGSYEEIGKIVGKSGKSIDNALQRLKKKIEKVIVDTSI